MTVTTSTPLKRGIIQSRGLGDIIIALPIAKYYHDQNEEIYWPICEEFYSSVVDAVPWVNWIKITTDSAGKFFYDTPLVELEKAGVDSEDILYLYQFLSNQPELTDPELFACLKFDQYKYWVSGVPFLKKWNLSECITRNPKREAALLKKLKITGDYAVVHLKGSNCVANLDLSWIENLAIVNVDEHLTDNIFDWIGILESAKVFVGIDSVFANLVDSLQLNIPEKYWLRRSGWDLTPVLGMEWLMIDNPENLTDPKRIVIKDAVAEKAKTQFQGTFAATKGSHDASALKSTVPFQSAQRYPNDFMGALKK